MIRGAHLLDASRGDWIQSFWKRIVRQLLGVAPTRKRPPVVCRYIRGLLRGLVYPVPNYNPDDAE